MRYDVPGKNTLDNSIYRKLRYDIPGKKDSIIFRSKSVHTYLLRENGINPFTTGNPFLGTKLLGFSIGRGSGALKGLRVVKSACRSYALYLYDCNAPSLYPTRCVVTNSETSGTEIRVVTLASSDWLLNWAPHVIDTFVTI